VGHAWRVIAVLVVVRVVMSATWNVGRGHSGPHTEEISPRIRTNKCNLIFAVCVRVLKFIWGRIFTSSIVLFQWTAAPVGLHVVSSVQFT